MLQGPHFVGTALVSPTDTVERNPENGRPSSRAKAKVWREVEALASIDPVIIMPSMRTRSGMYPYLELFWNTYRNGDPPTTDCAALMSGMANKNAISTTNPTMPLRKKLHSIAFGTARDAVCTSSAKCAAESETIWD